MKIDDSWYHFDASGWMQTGWLKDGDAWYYLRDDGQMVESTSYEVDGKRYYFFEGGRMAQNEAIASPTSGFEPDEILYFCSYYGTDGAHTEGWAKIPEFTLHRPISDVPGPFGSRPSIEALACAARNARHENPPAVRAEGNYACSETPPSPGWRLLGSPAARGRRTPWHRRRTALRTRNGCASTASCSDQSMGERPSATNTGRTWGRSSGTSASGRGWR
jgi:hypothetical protein